MDSEFQVNNQMIENIKYTDLINSVFTFQSTFLSLIRTVSVFIGISIIAKNKWILIFIIIVFLFSLINYHNINKHIIKLSKKIKDIKMKKEIHTLTNSIYAFSILIIVILILVIIQKEI
jgi:uncharacterized membrane protein YqgA involved in biofilm formation